VIRIEAKRKGRRHVEFGDSSRRPLRHRHPGP
jgi:hypothetical protein